MGANDVEIGIGSRDNSAPTLDAVKARLDELGKKAVTASVDVNDKAAQHELDLFNAKLAETAKRVASPRIDVAGAARANATLSGLEIQLDKLAEASATARAGVDTGDSEPKLGFLAALLDKIGAKSVSARVSVDDSGFAGKLAGDAAAADGFSMSMLKWPAVIGGAMAALPAIPGALAGIGAAAGVTALAFGPVMKALSDSAKAASSSAASQGQSSAQVAQTEQANSQAIVSAQQAISDARTQAAHDAITSAETIKNAQQAVADAETQAAHDAITSAEQIKSAQRSAADARTQAAHDAITSAEQIKNAQQSVADAEQQAVQDQASAEKQLEDAQYNEAEAQQALTDAREAAVRQLQALHDAEADTALGVKQASLDVQEAQANQAQVDADGKSTALQRQQAELAVAEAEQRLKEATEARTNAAQDAAKGDKEGVDGAPGVVSAKHNVAQAEQAQADAATNLAQVEKTSAKSIAQAVQQLADIQRGASWQSISDKERVAQSEQSLADAQRNAVWQRMSDNKRVGQSEQSLADAERSSAWQRAADAEHIGTAQQNLIDTYKQQALAAAIAASSGGASASAFKQDMAALTPAARKFVLQLQDMKGSYHSLQGTAETAIFPGLTVFLSGIQSLMPTFDTEIQKMGSILGGAFTGAGKALQSSGVRAEIKAILDDGNKMVSVLLPAFGSLAGAFLDLGSKSGTFTTGLAKGLAGVISGVASLIKDVAGNTSIADFGTDLGKWGDAFANWAKSKAARDDVDGFMKYLGKNGSSIVSIVKDLAKYVPGITSGASTTATLELKALSDFLSWVNKLPPSWSKPITELAGAMLVLKKTGMLSVGVKLVGLAGKALSILSGGTINLGGASAASEIGAAIRTAGAQVAAEFRAAIKGGGAVGGAEEGGGGAAAGAGGAAGGLGLVNAAAIAAGAAAIATGIILKVREDLKAGFPAIARDVPTWFSGVGGILTISAQGWADVIVKKFQKPVSNCFDSVRHYISNKWDQIYGDLKKAWNEIVNWVQNKLDRWRHDIAAKWDQIFSDAKDLFTKKIPNIISSGWNGAVGWVHTKLDDFRHWLSGKWGDIGGDLSTFFTKTIPKTVSSGWDDAVSWVHTKLKDFQGWLSGKWGDIGTDATKGWNALEGIFKKPVNFLIKTVYDNGIKRLWNDVVNAVGAKSLDLPNVATLSKGGKLGGYGGGDVLPALLEPGETVVSKEHSPKLAGAFAAVGVPGYSAGGIIGGALDVLKLTKDAVTGSMSGFASDFASMVGLTSGGGASGDYAKLMVDTPVALVKDLVKAGWATLTGAAQAGGSGSGNDIVSYARSWLGKIPYVFGGTSWNGDDCSGFTQAVYKHFGYSSIPRTSEQQGSWVTKTSSPQTGGLAFFNSPAGGPPPGHVGIITGANSMISQAGPEGALGPTMGSLAGRMFVGVPPGGFATTGGKGGSPSANAALARKMYPAWGSGEKWREWNYIAQKESSWSDTAMNPSGAFGIAQALDHGTAADRGSMSDSYGGEGLSHAQAKAANSGNAGDQIKWMHDYILDRYGSIKGAYNYHVAHGVYGTGGIVGGDGLATVGEYGRELVKLPQGSTVMPHGQTEAALGCQHAGPAKLQLEWVGSNGGDELMVFLRKNIRIRGGNVQAVLGR